MRLIDGLAFNGSVNYADAKLEVYGIKKEPFEDPRSPTSVFSVRPFELRTTIISRAARVTAETEACSGKLTRRMVGHLIQRKSRACLAVSGQGRKALLRDCGESDDQLTFLIFLRVELALM